MNKNVLVVATTSVGKLQEYRFLLKDKFSRIVSLRELNIDVDVEEDGTTFEQNALIKARFYHKLTGCDVIADDSGVCVDALNGEPGIYSARYSGTHGDDKANRDKLLAELKDCDNRKAFFCCVIAYITHDGREFTAEGKTFGSILREEVGNNGFGYDSIFYSDDLEMSFGKANEGQKNSISHRTRALSNLLLKL